MRDRKYLLYQVWFIWKVELHIRFLATPAAREIERNSCSSIDLIIVTFSVKHELCGCACTGKRLYPDEEYFTTAEIN